MTTLTTSTSGVAYSWEFQREVIPEEETYDIKPENGAWNSSMRTATGMLKERFEFSHTLDVKGSKQFRKIHSCYKATNIETSARIDNLSGDTLIIVNSHNIGNVKAKRVILLESIVDSVEADYLTMWYSSIKVSMKVNKKWNNRFLSPTKIASTLSCKFPEASIFTTRFNDKGVQELILRAGSVSDLSVVSSLNAQLSEDVVKNPDSVVSHEL